DWAFLLSLRHLHDEGVIRILAWNPMAVVGHLAWGELFAAVLGFSPTVARLSVGVLHLLECAALARLLRLCGVETAVVVAAILAFVFHPLLMSVAFTYDTDVTALAMQ